jgi:imidazolonepropionase-like amidohydrolase
MKVFLLAVFAALAGAQVPTPVVFENVTVIDATGSPPKVGVTVVVRNGRIEAIATARQKAAWPEGAQIVHARGKFLIPGLWDMHVHLGALDNTQELPLYIANGVTGIRIMWGSFPDYPNWRKDIERGQRVGPRMIIGSQIIDGPISPFPGTVKVSGEDEARLAVRHAKEQGADFIKVYGFLPRAAYFAIASEAKNLGMPFAGHVSAFVPVSETSNAGQASIEHLTWIFEDCSANDKDIRQLWADRLKKAKAVSDAAPTFRERASWYDTFDEGKASALYTTFVKNRTWQCPTLTMFRGRNFAVDPKLERDSRLKYVPAGRRKAWANARPASGDLAITQRLNRKQLEIVGSMHRAGVPIVAGTDVANPYCVPGFSLHDELQLLVEAGLSPMHALRAATYRPAEFLGKLDSLGSVEKGKIADLVLLDANPLENISNTTKIAAVMFGGKLFGRMELNKMLVEAETAAAKRN